MAEPVAVHTPGVQPIAKLDTPEGLYKGCCSCGWVSTGIESEHAALRSATQHARAKAAFSDDPPMRPLWVVIVNGAGYLLEADTAADACRRGGQLYRVEFADDVEYVGASLFRLPD